MLCIFEEQFQTKTALLLNLYQISGNDIGISQYNHFGTIKKFCFSNCFRMKNDGEYIKQLEKQHFFIVPKMDISAEPIDGPMPINL